MNDIIPFDFNQHRVRVVSIDGAPWFIASNVCRVLGLVKTDRAISALAPDERGTQLASTRGGPQQMSVISESGLYRLVMRSDKPQAREFQDWVTRVVLPAIRKDGSYVLGEEKVVTGELSEDDMIMRGMQAMQRKIDRLKAEKAQLAEENAVMSDELNLDSNGRFDVQHAWRNVRYARSGAP